MQNRRILIWIVGLVCFLSLFYVNRFHAGESHETTLLMETPSSSVPTAPLSWQDEHKLVVLLTEGRSGSTWLGTLFQLLHDVLYVFEPLDPRYVGGQGSEPLTVAAQLQILVSLCSCTFESRLPAFGKAFYGHNTISSVAKYDLARNVEKGTLHMEKFCAEFSITMAKCIRLSDLSILEQLPALGCPNYQVVHLVRDPRAIIRSRLVTFQELYTGNGERSPIKNFTDSDIQEAARTICNAGVANDVTSRAPWLADNYMRVRYEDLVGDPFGTVEELYRFIKRPVSIELMEFVKKSTSGTSSRSDFRVIKNSTAVSTKWKHAMKISHIRSVEETCSDFMQIYGYDRYET